MNDTSNQLRFAVLPNGGWLMSRARLTDKPRIGFHPEAYRIGTEMSGSVYKSSPPGRKTAGQDLKSRWSATGCAGSQVYVPTIRPSDEMSVFRDLSVTHETAVRAGARPSATSIEPDTGNHFTLADCAPPFLAIRPHKMERPLPLSIHPPQSRPASPCPLACESPSLLLSPQD
jgi:hypothetical protein